MIFKPISGNKRSKMIELDAAIKGDPVDPTVFADFAAVSAAHGCLLFDGYGRVNRSGQMVVKKAVVITDQGQARGEGATELVHLVQEAIDPWVNTVIATYDIQPQTTVALTARHKVVPVDYVSETGWHADDVPVVVASDVLPTEVAVGLVEMAMRDQMRYPSREARDQFIGDTLDSIIQMPTEQRPVSVSFVPVDAGYNYLFGASVQHREAPNMTDQPVERNFLRLGF